MKTILLLLSISLFLLGKANSGRVLPKTKYAPWRPHYPSADEDFNVHIHVRKPSKCTDCGPSIYPVGPYKYRPSYPRHRKPDKQNRRIPERKVFEIPDGQPIQIPDRSSPWVPHKPNLPDTNGDLFDILMPESVGPHPIISVPCVEKPKICPRKGSRDWSHSVIPDAGSAPRNLDSCECGITAVPEVIIQGSLVDPPFKYPWMVALQKRDGFTYCGGAIISDQFILTAAHCVSRQGQGFYDPSEIQVAFVTDTYLVSKGEEVTDIIPYPQYEYMNKDHDIALVKLKKRIKCSEQRRPICLPTHGMQAKIGQLYTIAGWGSREGGAADVSPYLMETSVKLVDFDKCSYQFSTLKENFHCLEGTKDSSPCHGDSGGPMFSLHQNRFYVFGVASLHSSGECNPQDVFVYTKVPNYLDWINNNMRG